MRELRNEGTTYSGDLIVVIVCYNECMIQQSRVRGSTIFRRGLHRSFFVIGGQDKRTGLITRMYFYFPLETAEYFPHHFT